MEENSYMKSVRFNLIDNGNKNLNKLKKVEFKNSQDGNEILTKNEVEVILENIFKKIQENKKIFKEIFFEVYRDKNFKKINDENFEIYSTISIKKPWFKVYCKECWDFKNNEIKIKESHQKINEFFNMFDKKTNELFETFENNKKILHNKKRNSYFSQILQEILSKNCFYALNDLIKNLNHKRVDISILEHSFSNLEKEFKLISKYFLSSKSVGVEILRGSFNSYTLNKNSKHYLKEIDDKIKSFEDVKTKKVVEIRDNKVIFRFKCNELEKKLISEILKSAENPPFSISKIHKHLFEKFENLKFDNYKNLCIISHEIMGLIFELTPKDLEIIENIKNELKLEFPISLENSQKFMKLFKANLKSDLFKDCMNKEIDFEDIKNYSCLFNSNEILRKIYDLTREIQKENKFQNTKKILELKRKRGKLLNSFNNWGNFISRYKRLSQELGVINTNIKNYEKEKYDCKKLNYWNLFLRKNNKTYLLFVPKENWREVENKLIKVTNLEISSNQIFRIKSLTKRALHKLCFNETGSFYLEHSKSFQDKINTIKKLDVEQKEKETLKILIETLQSDYAKERLDLEDFKLEESNVFQSENLDEFEERLEKQCYRVIPYNISDEILEEFETQFGVFKCEISSYDLNERFLDVTQTNFKSQEKNHTKEYWNNFWENLENSNIRLNPEIRVNFKEKDNQLEQYLINNRGVDRAKIENSHYGYNRNLEDKFIVQFSFLKNSGKKFVDLGFSTFEENKKHILEFNKKLNTEFENNGVTYLGLDIGEIELASLAVFRFDNDKKHNFNNKEILSPILPSNDRIKCLRLKDEYLKEKEKPSEKKLNYDTLIEKFGEIEEKQIISNISYFDDREEFFEEISPFGLDLTCAKVINGKIIKNADILTYLQYLKKLGKRRLFDLIGDEEFSNFQDFYLEWEFEKDTSGQYKTNNLVLKFNGEKIKNKKGEISSKSKIFTFIYKYEGVQTKNDIYNFDLMKEYFEDYLDDLKNIKEINNDLNSDKIIQVPQINNLRDSLVSNMIGVISLLKKELGNCYIVLENEESKNSEDKHIIKRLELALYQKFQTFGLVPPQIKELMEFRKNVYDKKKEEYIQIGNILFVSSSETSSLCPFCEVKEEKYHHKNGEYECSNCNFKTNSNLYFDEFEVLNSNDIVASYNIAKSGFKFIQNLKK